MVNNNYNQQMGQYNSAMAGMGQLAGAGIGMLLGAPTGGFGATLAGQAVKGFGNMFNRA